MGLRDSPYAGDGLPEDLWALLEQTVRHHGERTAVLAGSSGVTYRALHARAAALAAELVERGVSPGEPVALAADNSPAFLAATYAVAGCGGVLLALNTRLAPLEAAAVLRDAGTRLALADGANRAWIEEARAAGGPLGDVLSAEEERPHGAEPPPRSTDPDAPAHLYYTSGTTGRPKGVVLTHANVVVHAAAAARGLGLGPDDRWGHFAPMFHLADAWASVALTLVGGAHVFVPRFDADRVLACIEDERVTATNLVPTMLVRMMAAPRAAAYRPGALRLLLSGGAPMAPALLRSVLALFRCEYVQTYGLTETSPFLTLGLLTADERRLPEEERLLRLARTGRPFPAVEVRVVDSDGRPVPADDRGVGEVCARGPTVSPGYWNDPAETAAAHRDGWFHTGDLARVDATGSLLLVDRKKDVILSGGENVYSTEVENALSEHPDVLEAAVVGLPDEEWGERVHAAVVLRPGARATPEDLVAFCRGRIAGYKVPRSVEVRAELPRTGSGKLAKRLLRRAGSEPLAPGEGGA